MNKTSDFDASQKATMSTTNNGSIAQIAPKDHNLELVEKLQKLVRLIAMGEMDEQDLTTMEDINEAVKAFSSLKKAWTTTFHIPFLIENWMMALEEAVKMNLSDSA